MLQSVEVRRREELEGAFASMLRERPGALLMTGNPVHQVFVGRIIELAAKQRRPVMYQLKENVERGGLISYGPLRSDLMRRAAVYVDKILKGTSSLLLRADRVIE
jgi:putative ABC transport system substrate-binding protein